jgi:hypothetical protein
LLLAGSQITHIHRAFSQLLVSDHDGPAGANRVSLAEQGLQAAVTGPDARCKTALPKLIGKLVQSPLGIPPKGRQEG